MGTGWRLDTTPVMSRAGYLLARQSIHCSSRAGQAIGGGVPCTLADSAGSQPQTAHACRTDD
jgi:hypothetical protein